MQPLRFAIFGTGFWSRFQLAAWQQLAREGHAVQCIALYNRTRAKAQTLGEEFGVSRIYDDAETLLRNETLDFVDIITDVNTHRPLVELCAQYKVPVICQKPMAPTLSDARAMLQACQSANVPLYIHENWRWQTPLRALSQVLAEEQIGEVFRARLEFNCSFPVFDNQPFLKELEQFILTDIGSHVLDSARFLFGEASDVLCHTRRVNPDINGEDVATVMMHMNNAYSRDATVICEMSYASRTQRERFPQTFALVEGAQGSVELTTDYWLHLTTQNGTLSQRVAPPRYAWADPEYDVVHASILECNRDLLGALRGQTLGETRGEDNLQTVELVFACYDSARENRVIKLS